MILFYFLALLKTLCFFFSIGFLSKSKFYFKNAITDCFCGFDDFLVFCLLFCLFYMCVLVIRSVLLSGSQVGGAFWPHDLLVLFVWGSFLHRSKYMLFT